MLEFAGTIIISLQVFMLVSAIYTANVLINKVRNVFQ